ncbi:MAG TPA: SDR family oxidoreductase [Paracoccaceae bacterium]|nr:SDR family oxidoreductase [Paracoccaceae bacterium]
MSTTGLPGDETPRSIALVTGASRGLGFAVARALGATGWQVVALARTVGGLEELADAVVTAGGPNPTLVPLSLTDDGGMQRLCLAIHERWGRLDLVVHCAAYASPLAPADHVAPKDWTQAVEVNLAATGRLLVMTAPLLRASPRGGTFVFCADSRGGQPLFGSYGATKAGAEALVRSWAAESERLGPRVMTFHPNPMPTALRARFYPGENRDSLTPTETEAERLLAILEAEATTA